MTSLKKSKRSFFKFIWLNVESNVFDVLCNITYSLSTYLSLQCLFIFYLIYFYLFLLIIQYFYRIYPISVTVPYRYFAKIPIHLKVTFLPTSAGNVTLKNTPSIVSLNCNGKYDHHINRYRYYRYRTLKNKALRGLLHF